MPTYEYECESCGLRFEKFQRFSEDPVKECPQCEGPVHRVMQAVGVIFKGSGFYVTDNRSKSSTAPSTKRDDEGASESKPEAPAASEPSKAVESATKSTSAD